MSQNIKFNAGKVDFDETTRECKPLPQKGQIIIKPSLEDPDFYALAWSPRDPTAAPANAEELLLIPGDVTFSKVSLCRTGRVFSLSFLLLLAKHFFWLQDVADLNNPGVWSDKDENLLLNITDRIDVDVDDISADDDDSNGNSNTESKPAEPAPGPAATAATDKQMDQ